jgi:hypothetical protein
MPRKGQRSHFEPDWHPKLHSSPANRAKAAELGTDALQFDGCAEIWVDSIEDWEELLADPDFQKRISRTRHSNDMVFQTDYSN